MARKQTRRTAAVGVVEHGNSAELYAASLLAIDPEGDAERGYLALLAARLKLDPGLVEHLHANAAGAAAREAA